MKTFKQSAAEFFSSMSRMVDNVGDYLETMPDTESLGVAEFSKSVAAATGYDEAAIAGLIRTIVRTSDEYKNCKGRTGGVRRTEAAIALRSSENVVENSNADETEEEPPLTERAPTLERVDFFGMDETDEVAA